MSAGPEPGPEIGAELGAVPAPPAPAAARGEGNLPDEGPAAERRAEAGMARAGPPDAPARLGPGRPASAAASAAERLIDRRDGAERNVEKLLHIADALMRQFDRVADDRGAAFVQFQRAAMLEGEVQQRTRELEAALDLLGSTNLRLAEANSATERTRRQLADAIEAIHEGLALFDAEDRLVLCNSRFCAPLPDMRERLRPGLGFTDFVRHVSRSRHIDRAGGQRSEDWAAVRMLRHRQRDPVFNVELTGDRWLQVSERRTRDGGTVVVHTDVTDLVRAERHERGRLLDDQARIVRATLDHIYQGVCIFDASRRLVAWNRRFVQLLDITAPALRPGMTFARLAQDMFRDASFGEGTTLQSLMGWIQHNGPRAPLSFELRRTSGVILDVFAQEMPDHGIVVSFTDVTRERLAIHAMLRANATLEDRVAARTLELQDALATAERANFTRARFVAAASHDLLQPLSATKLFLASAADAAADGAGTETVVGTGSKLASTLAKARNALSSVETILGALLDISRLDSGVEAVEVDAVPLAPLFARLREEFAPLAAGKGLRIHIRPCRFTVASDPAYLRRILQNLIGNAIRYTDRGGVLVGARLRGDRLRIEVRDTGRGIPAHEQTAVFREFHRVDGASSAEGMGLGLAVVDRACALLGHPLSLWSEPGRGTRFTVELALARMPGPHQGGGRPGATRPADAAAPAPGAAEAGQDRLPPPEDRIVLLIENDGELRRALVERLEQWGLEALDVGSGEEALDLLDEIGIVPDLFLIDQQLGEGMTGLETLALLRLRHGDRPARIISADRSPELREACAGAGVPLMAKPIAQEALETFVLGPDWQAAER